jgi:hypothetical protein
VLLSGTAVQGLSSTPSTEGKNMDRIKSLQIASE